MNKLYDYVDFFKPVIKVEGLAQMLQAEQTKELIPSDLVCFRTINNKLYEIFFPWKQSKRLCGQFLNKGAQLGIII